MSAVHPSGSGPTRAPRRMARLAGSLIVASCLFAATAWLASGSNAQSAEQVTQPAAEVPALPTGAGTIRGRVVHPDDPTAGADLAIALYALRPDGRPGLGGTRSDASGRFEFANVSEDPGTVYLVGTQYRDVPFGRRVAFEAGQGEIEIELPLRTISDDASALLVLSTIYKIDWIGSQLFVQVTHQLQNPDDTVIHVPAAARAGRSAVFSAQLPAGVVEFVDGQGGLDDGLVREGESLTFWGPVYPGEQEVRYGFVLEGPSGDADGASGQGFTFELPQRAGAGEVQILTREADPRPTAVGLETLPEPTLIEGVSYVRSSVGGFVRGGVLELTIDLPASSPSIEALRIARADYWIDADDTAMRVTAEIQLANDSDVRLLAPGDGSLLGFALPEGAEFLGVSGPGQALGTALSASGGIDVRGPIPPGPSSLEFRYSIPLRAGEAELDLSFTVPVALLNVLVADTGLIVESERLHRRRPFKQGTRSYLHREAFQIAAGEQVPIRLVPFDRREMPGSVSAIAGLVVAAATAAFLIVPLRRATRGESAGVPERSELSLERENVYEALGDLEDDHATGKIDAADFERMRGDLRATAIELLRRERDEAVAGPTAARRPASCPGCHRAIEPQWRFCSHCGKTLEPIETEPRA